MIVLFCLEKTEATCLKGNRWAIRVIAELLAPNKKQLEEDLKELGWKRKTKWKKNHHDNPCPLNFVQAKFKRIKR